MNRTEAYMKCNEIMLSNPNHVAHENEGISYVLCQIADTGPSMAIQTFLIDPAVPEGGNIRRFLDLEETAQIAILALNGVSEAVRSAHEHLKYIKTLGSEKETAPEAAEALRAAFRKVGRHEH